jgi:hypothetical protein
MKVNWDKVKTLAGKFAPILGSAIMPIGGGTAGALLAEVLGVAPEPEEIAAALLEPGAQLKLTQIQATHKERLIELGTANDKAHLLDTADARKAAVETLKAGGTNRPMYTLGAIITVGFFGVLAFLLSGANIPEANMTILLLAIGALIGNFNQVVGFFFGSSKSSSDKNKLLIGKGGA